jgi:hypothetical protein
MHFQTWQDKAGNFTPVTDPTNGLTFPTLAGELLQPNLIMPEPCPFLSKTHLPACSIVRPTNTRGAATAALNFLTNMNLFMGQKADFFKYMKRLAADADAARRQFSRFDED